jgi:rhodanese-related sulfurtransferase
VTIVADLVGSMTAPELKGRLEHGEPLTVLDVREDDERAFAAIALPGGMVDLHIPLGDVRLRFDEIQRAAEGRPLVVYCHHGQRSMVAATWLARRGLADVHNLEGGIDAWSTSVDRAIRRY